MSAWLALLWLLPPLLGAPCHGQQRTCYSGPSGTAGVGTCHKGVQLCVQDTWGPCTCESLPQQEICDCKDNNCDGQVDQSCSCGCPGTTRPCGFRPGGQCRRGTQRCVGLGNWGLCEGTIGPASERCDGKDNDCDGQIDEALTCGPCQDGATRSCFDYGTALIGEGPCRAGVETCQGGSWGPCVGQILPQPEVCDNIDNNCNGFVDGMERLCGSDVGACRKGSQVCELGKWGECRGEVKPVPERCDCRDNDCDGQLDEEVRCPQAGHICHLGRCVPNCYQGVCLRPGEVVQERPSGREPPVPEWRGPPEGGYDGGERTEPSEALVVMERLLEPFAPDRRVPREVLVDDAVQMGGEGPRREKEAHADAGALGGCGCGGAQEVPWVFWWVCLCVLAWYRPMSLRWG